MHIVPGSLRIAEDGSATALIDREILGPEDTVTLVVAPHPLRTDRQVFAAPAGLSIAELVEFASARIERLGRRTLWAAISGHPVPQAYWPRVRPKPGTTLVLRAVAGDGGGDILKSVLMVGIAAAGILVTGGALVPLFGTAFASGQFLASLAGAAVTIGGTLALNALFPAGGSALASNNASQTYSLAGGANAANPYGPVPVNLGTNRIYPPLLADTYTEFSGSDQYLRMLVGLYGPNDISAIKIGETDLANFSDVQSETRNGYSGDTAVTLYPESVFEVDLAIELTAAAGWQTQTTGLNVDEISIDIVAPGGLVDVDSSGNSQVYSVTINAEYSPTGAGTWSPLGTLVMKARSTDPIRDNISLNVTRGQYDVRVQKAGADYSGSDQVQEEIVWTALRGFRNTPPLTFPKPLSLLALRIKATSQLNGTVDQLNFIAQSRCKSWNGSAWVDDTVTSNPADLFRFVLQHPANALPVDDTGIDLDTLASWADYCRAQSFAFNMVRDSATSVYDCLTDIATAGRALVLFRDGKWSVAWDDPTAPIVQHFTPRNSWGFSGEPSFPQTPHAFRVRFVNEANGYQQDERVVYDDGYNADGSGGLTAATLFEQIEFPGITNPDQIWRMGRFHIAQARLRPEVYTINVDIEHLVCTRNDRVLVNHDVPEWGLGAGRVKAVADPLVTLDDPVTMVGGQSYCIRFRLADGSTLLRDVATDDGQQTTISLAGTGSLPSPGDLYMFGEVNAETVVLRVRSITPNDDLSAKVAMVDDAPSISSADAGTIPPFSTQITPPFDLFTAAPINLTVKETLQGVGGALDYGAVFSWETPAGQQAVSFDVEYRDDGGDAIWKPSGSVTAPTKSLFIDVTDPGLWSFRVRSIFPSGLFSNWATLGGQTIQSATGVPLPQVTGIRTSFQAGFMWLYWDEINDFRSGIRYKVKKGPTFGSAQDILDVAHDGYVVFGEDTFWVVGYWKAPSGAVVYSQNPTSLTISGNLLAQNVIKTSDQQAEGWPGTFSNVAKEGVDPTAVIRLDGHDAFLAETDFLGQQDFLNPGGVAASGSYTIADADIVDVGYVAECPINVTWTATGAPVGADFLSVPDFLAQPDFLGAASAQFVSVRPFIAVDAHPATGAFGDWQAFVPNVYRGRRFKFMLVLTTADTQTIAYALSFSYQVTVPGRVDHYQNLSIGSGGLAITYQPDGAATAAPFNGGPNAANLPLINVSWPNQASGDHWQKSGESLSGFTIQLFDSTNTPKAASGISITVEGF